MIETMNAEQALARLRPALERRDRPAINAIIARLLTLNAPLANQWRSMAALASTHGEVTLARRAMQAYAAANGNAPQARFEWALQEAANGQLVKARELLRALPPDFPDPVSRAHIEGTTALNVGDPEAALDLLLRAVTLRPGSGPSWLSLAMATDMSKRPDLAERIVAAEPGFREAEDAEQGPFYYALGKTCADNREHARAFAAFDTGARAVSRLRPFDRGQDLAEARASLDGYSESWRAGIAGRLDRKSDRPIFVMGLPRSGTTLTEQILVSHSAVDQGGEINRMAHLGKQIGGTSPRALDAYLAQGHEPGDLTAQYLHLITEFFQADGRIVDKSLNSQRSLGQISALLPDAPLVWLLRDPLDCAWSCFRTYFFQANSWSFNLEEIAAHMRLELALLDRWRDLLGERLLVIPFEEMVAEPEPWIGKLLDHCGLPVEPACFAPEQTERVVTTASTMQVRQAINRKGIGTAEPYREQLAPFIELFESLPTPRL